VLDSNAPAVNADAHDQAGRMIPRRSVAARAANPIASSASAGAEPHSPGAGRPGANADNQRVKWARIASAQRRNRRRHPRTSGHAPLRGRNPCPSRNTRRRANP